MCKKNNKPVKSKFRPEFPSTFRFDYKDPVTLSGFLMDGGKITPQRVSKLSYLQHSQLTRAIKKARYLCLLPLGVDAYDTSGRPEQISAVPFEIN